MAVKAVALVTLVRPGTNAGTFKMNVKVVGLDIPTADDSIVVDNVAPTIIAPTLEANIKSEVSSYLTTNYGYTFTILDSVRLIGALL